MKMIMLITWRQKKLRQYFLCFTIYYLMLCVRESLYVCVCVYVYWCMEVICVVNVVYMGSCMLKLKGLDALWQFMKMDRTMTPTMFDIGESFL